MSKFEQELASLLNKYNFDTVCDTPDFILAQNIVSHLAELTTLVRGRDKWLARETAGQQIEGGARTRRKRAKE